MSVRLVNCLRTGFARYANIHSQFQAKSFHFDSTKLNEAPADNISTSDSAAESKPEEKKGTKDNPVMVASATNKCIVGCNCGADEPTIKWFFLNEGSTQVCDCGFYFKLDKTDENQAIPEHARIMTVDDRMPDPRYGRRGMPFFPPKKMRPANLRLPKNYAKE
ncbi:uncharacterized protein LOC104266137 [Ciona intestinalis]